MKKTQLILAAAALVVFASCTNDNYTPKGNVDNEIGFNAVTRLATRANNAIVTGATYAEDNTFQVWGWQSPKEDFSEFADDAASNFMTNLTISYTTGRDTERAKAWRNEANYYYWPFTGKISFLAIHPSTVAPTTTGWDATNDIAKATIDDYTVVDKDSTDLMFAVATGARRADALPLKFYHALSQVQFCVKTDVDYTLDNVVFKVDSVGFNNIDLTGDVAYENEVITWSNNTAQTEAKKYVELIQTVTKDVADYGRALVMIPQPAYTPVAQVGEPGDPDYVAPVAGTTLTIKYTMQQNGYGEITGYVTVSAPQAWEAGKRYLYTLNFRLNEITFNPSVNTWVDVNVTTINIL